MSGNAVEDFIERILQGEDVSGKTVLELGSRDVNGSCRSYVESLNPGKYVGLDIEYGDNVDIVADVNDLPMYFENGSFDVVISCEMMEHIEDWRNVISNMKNVAKPGGIIVITTRSRGFFYHGYPHDFWRYETSDMEYIFSDFEILALESDPSGPGVFIKAKKPENFLANKLNNYSLYSIITGERVEKAPNDTKMPNRAFHPYLEGHLKTDYGNFYYKQIKEILSRYSGGGNLSILSMPSLAWGFNEYGGLNFQLERDGHVVFSVAEKKEIFAIMKSYAKENGLNTAHIYNGPFTSVTGDMDIVIFCDKHLELLSKEYAQKAINHAFSLAKKAVIIIAGEVGHAPWKLNYVNLKEVCSNRLIEVTRKDQKYYDNTFCILLDKEQNVK